MRNDKNIIYVNAMRIASIAALFVIGILFYSHVSQGRLAEVSPDFVRWIKTLGGLFVIHSLFMIYFDLQPDSFSSIRPFINLILNGCYAVLIIGLLSSIEMIPVFSFSKDGIEILTDNAYANTPLRVILYILLGIIGISIMKSLKEIWGRNEIEIQET